MKKPLVIIILLFTSWLCKAQSAGSIDVIKANKEMIQMKIKTATILNLKTKVAALPLNLDKDALKKVINDNNQVPLVTQNYNYNYQIDFGERDMLKVKVKVKADPDLKEGKKDTYKYETYITYICTDARHQIKHTALNLEMMKKVQADNKCNGYTIKIYDLSDY